MVLGSLRRMMVVVNPPVRRRGGKCDERWNDEIERMESDPWEDQCRVKRKKRKARSQPHRQRRCE